MDAPRKTVTLGACTVTLMGTVPGFVPDGERVAAAIAEVAPEAIALGVPDSDVETMEALIADPTLADGLEPDALDLHFLQQVAEWGSTQFIPSPDLHAAHEAGLPIHGIDLSDEVHTRLFTETVKLRHLAKRGSVRKRLGKTSSADATDPYDLARQWDHELCRIKPLGALEQAREAFMASEVARLAAEHTQLLVVVHAARFDGVHAALQSA